MTQKEKALKGDITPQMKAVAKIEGLDPDMILKKVATGTVVIPANDAHKGLKPMGIGEGLKTKVNANIGTSKDCPHADEELVKLKAAVDAGADTLMDLSTGGDLEKTRRTVIDHSPIPVGTVPIYQVAIQAVEDSGAVVHMGVDAIFRVIETQARDGVDLSISSHLIEDIPSTEPAVFELYCGNTSESGEERIYEIKLIPASNPEGAAITIGGNPTTDPIELVVPPNQALKQTLRVEQRPPAFDYNSLQVMMYPPCQYELFQQNMPIVIADTVTFSVHFDNSGSPVFLYLPETNWVIDQSDTRLDYAISDYDLNVADSIMLQYKPEGGSWWTAASYATGSLTDSIKATWDVSDTTRYPDGSYQLRAAAKSEEGINFSNISFGIIDRNALVVVTAEPSDGVLHSGDEICVHFSDNIDDNTLAGNVTLITVEDSTALDISLSCSDNTLTIQTEQSLTGYAGKYLTATVCGLKSISECQQRKSVSWTFMVSEDYTPIMADPAASIPDDFYLKQNYPNPFNPTTTLTFELPKQMDIKLIVYDILGRRVRTLINGPAKQGVHAVLWNATNDHGFAVSSGVYFYRLTTDNYDKTMKMVLMR